MPKTVDRRSPTTSISLPGRELSEEFDRAVAGTVATALAEDFCSRDVTTLWTVPSELRCTAEVIVKEPGVIAGLPVLRAVLRQVDPSVIVRSSTRDGAPVEPGQAVVQITGSARSIITAERTALNFLQRLSGIATLAAKYVAAVEGTGVSILDTRKTAPGLRLLDKYAVTCGGALNHRRNLAAMVLIKENHVAAAGGVAPAIAAARAGMRSTGDEIQVEVEVTNRAEASEALSCAVDWLLLDNMTTADLSFVARHRDALPTARPPRLEASGSISLDTVAAVAATGVEAISVGAVTHSAPALDLSLLIRDAASEVVRRQPGSRPVTRVGDMLRLDPEVRALLDHATASSSTSASELTAEAVRVDDLSVLDLQRPPEDLHSVSDIEIPSARGVVPARVYRPRPGPLQPLLFLHGGGFVVGRDGYEAPLRELALAADCLLIAPECRLAPENPFPAAADDAIAVARWLAAEATTLGSSTARLGIAGDSSGGNLAAAATHQLAREGAQPAYQLLIYPMLDATASSASYTEFAEGYGFTRQKSEWYFDQYLPPAVDRHSPRASPLFDDDLSAAPRTLVVTAEFDPLRDDGERYAERLRHAGVTVEAPALRRNDPRLLPDDRCS